MYNIGFCMVFYHHSMLEYKENPNDQYMNYIHKGYVQFHTSLGLILGQTVDDKFESSHVQHRDLCGFGDYAEAYKTYLQKNSWTHLDFLGLQHIVMIKNQGIIFHNIISTQIYWVN